MACWGWQPSVNHIPLQYFGAVEVNTDIEKKWKEDFGDRCHQIEESPKIWVET